MMSDSPVKEKPSKRTHKKFCSEDIEILNILEDLRKELDFAHKNLDYLTDTTLIDGCIYEIKALHMKYEYYLKISKERGLIAEGFSQIS